MTRIATNSAAVPDAASVGELCSMLSLSKRRFYELQKAGVFPFPTAYLLRSRRPIYFADAIRACLEVRRRNVGLNGQVVLFYAARSHQGPAPRAAAPRASAVAPSRARSASANALASQPPSQHAEWIDALAALGVEASAAQVAAAVREAYPSGTAGAEDGEVVRRLYQQIRARNRADNVQR